MNPIYRAILGYKQIVPILQVNISVVFLIAICEDYSARIIVGDTETAFYLDETVAHPTYFINHELAAGRIELCLEGMWRPICQDFWTNRDASVVCHQLGFSRAGKKFFFSSSSSIFFFFFFFLLLSLYSTALGAVNGSQRFQLSTSADVQLIQMNFDCNGTENHLNRCPISDPESRLPECSGIRRNVYIACQCELKGELNMFLMLLCICITCSSDGFH